LGRQGSYAYKINRGKPAMKILYTLHSHTGNPGGMEQHVLDLITGMVQRSHEVHVFCRAGVIADWYKRAGAQVTICDINYDLDPVYVVNLVSYLRKHKIQIVHAHELRAVANSLLAGFVARTPVKISHTHTPISEWQTPNLAKELFTKLTIFGYANEVNMLSSTEIALTESRKRIKMQEGINPNKLHIIPNGIVAEKFSDLPSKSAFRQEILAKYAIPQNAFVFGNVSRLTEEKDHETLIQAFSVFMQRTVNRDGEIALLIAGGGPLEQTLRQQVKKLGLEHCVKITGVFDETDKLKMYAAFDAFVFTSQAEGFGIVLLEAMSAGLPILCSNLEVLQEVGGAAALYFNVHDPADLAQKMIDLYARRANLQNLMSNAQTRVKDLFTLEKFDEAYETLYLQLLEKL